MSLPCPELREKHFCNAVVSAWLQGSYESHVHVEGAINDVFVAPAHGYIFSSNACGKVSFVVARAGAWRHG